VLLLMLLGTPLRVRVVLSYSDWIFAEVESVARE
jgi:hypothetical protein